MSDSVTFKLEGFDELLEKFEQLGERARQAVIEAAQAGADVVQAAANPNAPGPNIQTRVSEKKLGQATVDIGPDREHWYYQFAETGATYHEIKGAKRLLTFEGEQGLVRARLVRHPGMPAAPFLRPAIDENQDEAAAAAMQEFMEAIQTLLT